MKKLFAIMVILGVALIFPACGKEAKSLKEELRVVKEENSFLKAENIALKKEVEELYRKIEEKTESSARTAGSTGPGKDRCTEEGREAAGPRENPRKTRREGEKTGHGKPW